nr:hypothetical protein [Tanacetum cinerariifolium]
MVKVKVLMALAEDNNAISKEGAKNGKWVKISMRKLHTLLEMKDNDDGKTYLDYLCIDLNYVEEQRNNILSKHRDLVHELNTCKEQLSVLKQAKLDFLTMHHVNTPILKENKNLRTKLKELTTITETWLNSSNKVNQCINEQIPSQKKRILKVEQLTEDPSSFGQKYIVFVKSLADDQKVFIPGVKRQWLSKAKGFILPNHDTGRILTTELQRNTTGPPVAVTDSSASDYNSADESSDFQDSPDNERDTKSSHEYINNLEEEYQEKALLAKSRRFFKKGTQMFSSAKETNQTKCHKCGKKDHFARDCWNTKDFEAKYNKVKAKLALLSSSASAPSSFSSKNKGLIDESHDWDEEHVSLDNEETKFKALMALTGEERISIGKESARNGKNKGLIAESYDWDEEGVSYDDNEVLEVKALMDLVDKERGSVSKESARNGEWIKISMKKDFQDSPDDEEDTRSSQQYLNDLEEE